MNFVEPSVTLLTDDNPMKIIEKAYRICYKSEDKMKNDSDRFITSLLYPSDPTIFPHTSPLAHRRIAMFVDHEIMHDITYYQKVSHNYHIEHNQYNFRSFRLTGNLRAFFDYVNSPIYQVIRADVRTAVNNLLADQFPVLFKKREQSLTNSERSGSDLYCAMDAYGRSYYTFHIVTTRDILQQIARHTTISINAESTRYCNYGKKGMTFVIPRPYSWCNHTDFSKYEDYAGDDSMVALFIRSAMQAEYDYNKALELDYPPEEARMLLPGSLKTELIATGTYDQWNHFTDLRSDRHAHPQIRYISDEIRTIILKDTI